MKKILFLFGFLCLGLTAFASQGKNERIIAPISNYAPLEEFYDDLNPKDGPDIKIKIALTLKGENIGVAALWSNDGKECITIEIWLEGILFGTMDNCP